MHAKGTYYDTNIASVVIQRVPVWYRVCGFLFYYPFVSVLPLSFKFSYFTSLTTLPARRQFAGSSAPNQTKPSTFATAFFFSFTFLTWRFFVKYTWVSYMCFRHREYEGRRRGRGRRKLNPSTLRCGFVVEFSIRLT